jgi:hypothetical protein
MYQSRTSGDGRLGQRQISHTGAETQRKSHLLRASGPAALIILFALFSTFFAGGIVAATTQQPQPFPRPGTPVKPAQPVAPAPAPAPPSAATPAAVEVAPTETNLGVPIFPGAQFIASYDAGRGQRYYIFGSAASFVELVAYYRTMLKQKGELVYDVPATHEFDVGRYREETMAFPPGVTIKDFQSDVSQGYPNPKRGAQPDRFPTIIQIVPVTERP